MAITHFGAEMTAHHLIVTHEVTNVGSDRVQLSPMAKAARDAMVAANADEHAHPPYTTRHPCLAATDTVASIPAVNLR